MYMRTPSQISDDMREVRRSIRGEERDRDARANECPDCEQEMRQREASILMLYQHLGELDEERRQARRYYR